ncbi:hypothetical protein BDR07DRAFT_1309790, partial [Suillus spraguei]
INLFRLVVNPHNFAQPVENIYYLTFLICDGICGMDYTENGEPIICEWSPLISVLHSMVPVPVEGSHAS